MKQIQFWLRLEGLVILALAVMTFAIGGVSWWWFAAGLFLPDVSMVGYLAGNKVGAWGYNLGHALVLPLLIIGFGYLYLAEGVLSVGLIWLAHIGLDRLLGYGLKADKGFKHTHLGTIGKK